MVLFFSPTVYMWVVVLIDLRVCCNFSIQGFVFRSIFVHSECS